MELAACSSQLAARSLQLAYARIGTGHGVGAGHGFALLRFGDVGFGTGFDNGGFGGQI
jgi:hypothetical protein